MSNDAIRRALASLAAPTSSEPGTGEQSPTSDQHGTYRETIERATAAVDDVEAAAQFVEDVGVDELKQAVEHADRSVSACADDGRHALAVFRDFKEAAEGEHFHPGHGTSLGGGDIAPSK